MRRITKVRKHLRKKKRGGKARVKTHKRKVKRRKRMSKAELNIFAHRQLKKPGMGEDPLFGIPRKKYYPMFKPE